MKNIGTCTVKTQDFSGATVVADGTPNGLVCTLIAPSHRAYRVPRAGDVVRLCIGPNGWQAVCPE